MKKALIIIIISIILVLAGYLTYRYFFYTCCALPTDRQALPPKSAPSTLNGNSVLDDSYSAFNDPNLLSDPNLLYAKRVLVGFCRTKFGDGGSCHYNTYLYSSGKLVIESGELAVMESGGEKATAYPTVQKELNKSSMDRIIRQIRDSGVMTKPCAPEMTSDLWVNYFINLDGVKKKVINPSCAEFREIDKLIDATTDKQP